MLTEFGKIFIFFLTAVFFVVAVVFVAKLIRPDKPTKEKLFIYECGEDAIGSPWVKFNIRFYVVALIFLIFDVEVVLLIPWAVVYKEFELGGFLVGAVFLFLLGLGMVYEWRKGDLEWAKPKIIPPIISEENLKEEKIVIEEIKPEAVV
ncbi:MAG: NADH-quinone oxidoreductase subunit A [Ignavibacteria bacterium]